MTEASEALETAISFEAVKLSYRQTKDGVAVAFLLSPLDMPTALATAPLGTRYIVGMCEIGDDEQVIDRQAAEPTAALTPPRNRSAIGKELYRNAGVPAQAVTRAARLPTNPIFRRWADVRDIPEAEQFIRDRIGSTSRAAINDDPRVYERFLQMETTYLMDTNQMPRPR